MRLLGLWLVMAAVLAVPAAADAEIVPGKGMAGVEVGMTESEVIAVLGQPDATTVTMDDFGERTRFRYTGHGGLTLVLRPGETEKELFSIATRRGLERTARGVGVGSAERSVKRKLRGERCKTEFGRRHCTIGSFLAGEIITDFRMRKGRVGSVVVGRVVD